MDEFKLLEIELASVEFFNNIIMHGFATRPRIRPKIMVSVALENGRVEVTFLDRRGNSKSNCRSRRRAAVSTTS